MRHLSPFIASTALVLAILAATSARAAERQDPKLIYYGFDSPRPELFAREVAGLEAADTPIDGTAIDFRVYLDGGGWVRPFQRGFSGDLDDLALPGPYRKRWFRRGIEAMRSANPTRITNNFIRFQSRPGSVDWFDDAGWEQIVDNFRFAAYAAKESGMKGMLFDPEPYVEGFAQFEYLLQTGFGARDFDAYAAKARERGRETMRAMQAEYPDITILSLFLNAYVIVPRFRSEPAFGLDDPKLSLVHNPYALLPYFLDGWLDVANEGVTIVDGNERAYYYNSPLEFDEVASLIENEGAELVSPANRDTYRRQVQVGSAVFLDAYRDDFPSQFQPDLPDGTSWGELFRRNLVDAMRTSDEYVWLYGEGGRLWSQESAREPDTRPWSEVLPFTVEALAAERGRRRGTLPGTEEALAAVLSERERTTAYARENRLAAVADGSAAAGNRVRNGTFTNGTDGWGYFADANRRSGGSLSWQATGADADGGALAIDGARASASFQSLDITPGEVLWVQADVSRTGWSEPSVGVGFRGPDNPDGTLGRFLRYTATDFFLPEWVPVAERGTDPSAWTRIEGAVTVPENATKLVLSLGVDGQRDARDVASFDNVAVFAVGNAADVPAATPVDPPRPDTTPPVPTPLDDALLINPGFDDGLGGWESNAAMPPSLVTGGPDGGGTAVAIEASNTGVVQTVPVQAGGRYSVSAAARVEGGADRGFVGVLFRDANGRNVAGAFDSRQVEPGDWQRYAVDGTVPAEAVEIGVFAWKENATGTLLADDFELSLR